MTRLSHSLTLASALSMSLLTAGAAKPASTNAASVPVTVRVDQPGAAINPAMWGVFFEDINGGADGGLYPELVRNRSFEFNEALMGWTGVTAACQVRTENSLNSSNPHYLHLDLASAGGSLSLTNTGFAGMGVERFHGYRFSAFGRSTGAAIKSIRAQLFSSKGRLIGSAEISDFPGQWTRREALLRASATDPRASLVVTFQGSGTLDVDMVSLFPVGTWKSRTNGLRPDLVQMLADLRPGFVRFPGGCIVEGHTLENRYQWKTTIGATEQRKSIMNRWNDEFKHRPSPDYFQSFGLGFFEYFQLCEDIGAQPLPILNCGMACQFNSGELTPLDKLDPYIQDALDLIEFANGDPVTPWGARRAAMGHPQPFGMKLLGVGNEQWGPQYIERYAAFAKVLKAQHPEIQLVSSAGPGPNDERFQYLWPKLRELNADIVDEHCYDSPNWFLDNSRRYDDRPRTGPKVFFGEYAAQSVKVVSPENRNTWGCALAEAAYMTGLERNADVVVMASYAPLFAHEERWQWRPNLIWMDNLRSYGTPNYYVQQLFSRNRGDHVIPVELGDGPKADNGQPRFYASAALEGSANAGYLIVKLVNATAAEVSADLDLSSAGRVAKKGRLTRIASSDLAAENSLGAPRQVAPAESSISTGSKFSLPLPAYSVSVLRVFTEK